MDSADQIDLLQRCVVRIREIITINSVSNFDSRIPVLPGVSTLAGLLTIRSRIFTVNRYPAITVDEETFERLTEVMVEYNCNSVAEAVAKSATIALETDEAALAQILANRLEE